MNVTTLTNRQYCVVLNPVDGEGRPQFGKKKVVRGEKTFFLLPGELLEKGIEDVFILGESEGLILRAQEGFYDEYLVRVRVHESYSIWMCSFYACCRTSIKPCGVLCCSESRAEAG